MKHYFDITDFVDAAKAHGAVSGIQRVQICVLKQLSSVSLYEQALCAYGFKRFSRIKVCRAQDLFTKEVYSASRMLIQLGLEKPNQAFSKRELYDDLAKYKKRSFGRALRKIKLLILGRLFPASARARMEDTSSVNGECM